MNTQGVEITKNIILDEDDLINNTYKKLYIIIVNLI